MLSTISGHHRAGSWPLPKIPPTAIYYSLRTVGAISGTTSGSTVYAVDPSTGDTRTDYNLTLSGSATFQTATTPYYMQMAQNTQLRNIAFPKDFNLTAGQYRTVSFWSYIATQPLSTQSMFDLYGTDYDGILTGLTSGRAVQAITNSRNYNISSISSVNVWPIAQWFMFTFAYTMSSTLPSKIYINDTLVHSFTHGSDVDIRDEQYVLAARMGSGQLNSRWNDLRLWAREITAVEVSSLYNTDRAYYGV